MAAVNEEGSAVINNDSKAQAILGGFQMCVVFFEASLKPIS